MAAGFPTPKRIGAIAVMGAFVNAAALGFPEWAALVARSVTVLLALALLVMVFTHRTEWVEYLRETRRRGRLAALVMTVVFGVAFVGSLTWLNWPVKQQSGNVESLQSEPRFVSPEMADAQADNAAGHERLQHKLQDAAQPEVDHSGLVKPTTRRTDYPSPGGVTIEAARIVFPKVGFFEDPLDPAHRQVQVTWQNRGPGPAYGGRYGFGFLQASKSDTDRAGVEKILNELRENAGAALLKKELAVEQGDEASFVIRGTVPNDLWKSVVAGTDDMYAILTYAYLDDQIRPGQMRLAEKVIYYHNGDGTGIEIDFIRQIVETVEKK